jgi:hypothetical protein
MWRTRPKRPGAGKALIQLGIGLAIVVVVALVIAFAR